MNVCSGECRHGHACNLMFNTFTFNISRAQDLLVWHLTQLWHHLLHKCQHNILLLLPWEASLQDIGTLLITTQVTWKVFLCQLHHLMMHPPVPDLQHQLWLVMEETYRMILFLEAQSTLSTTGRWDLWLLEIEIVPIISTQDTACIFTCIFDSSNLIL